MHKHQDKSGDDQASVRATRIRPNQAMHKQTPGFIDNRPEAIAQRKLQDTIRSTLNTNGAPIQRFPKTDLKDGLGSEFLHKHIAHAGPPALASQEDKENVLESVYYHRPMGDRRDVNTVFFADPAVIENDLKTTAGDDISYSTKYTTTTAYPAITVLRVFRENEGRYVRAQIQYGDARPVVKVNNGDGSPSFNHLQETNPKVLGNKVDVLE